MSLRVRLFWGKMISANHFPPNLRVWQQRKMKFSGKSFPVDQNLLLRPGNDFTLSFSLQIISGSRKREREREKECKRERARERTRAQPNADPANKREKERKHSLRSSHRHRSTSRRSRRAQPDDHQAKRRRPTVSESSNSHRSRPTHPVQLSQSIIGPASLITEPNTNSW